MEEGASIFWSELASRDGGRLRHNSSRNGKSRPKHVGVSESAYVLIRGSTAQPCNRQN